jgi:2-amino-4-hydroxy-6-hydroxymethyldihydropteridine diphosphokinase
MKAFLSLGSNLGSRLEALKDALFRIQSGLGSLVSCSSIFETEPWGFKSEQPFLNMVAEIESSLDPETLMDELLRIEQLMGRERAEGGYASRLIDLDILLVDGQVISGKVLQLPHPRMHLRKFVLVPLAEIAPEVIHPVLNTNIIQILHDCPDQSSVTLYLQKEDVFSWLAGDKEQK